MAFSLKFAVVISGNHSDHDIQTVRRKPLLLSEQWVFYRYFLKLKSHRKVVVSPRWLP